MKQKCFPFSYCRMSIDSIKGCFLFNKSDRKSRIRWEESAVEQLNTHEETIRRAHELQASYYTEKLLRRFQGHWWLWICASFWCEEKTQFTILDNMEFVWKRKFFTLIKNCCGKINSCLSLSSSLRVLFIKNELISKSHAIMMTMVGGAETSLKRERKSFLGNRFFPHRDTLPKRDAFN